MNKGIILEKHRHYMVLLTSDGTFQKGIVAKKNAMIGEEVEFKPCKKRFFFQMDRTDRRLVMKLGSVTILVALFIFSTFYFIDGRNDFIEEEIDLDENKIEFIHSFLKQREGKSGSDKLKKEIKQMNDNSSEFKIIDPPYLQK